MPESGTYYLKSAQKFFNLLPSIYVSDLDVWIALFLAAESGEI